MIRQYSTLWLKISRIKIMFSSLKMYEKKNNALEAFIYKASRASKKVATKNQLKITMMNDYFALLLS
jgi:hypothetical protein